jgi:DNA-binding NarL/FixJ family response regulator
MRTLLHLSSRDAARSISEHSSYAQPGRRRERPTQTDDVRTVALIGEVCPPASLDIESTIATRSLQRGRKSKSSNGHDKVARPRLGSSARTPDPSPDESDNRAPSTTPAKPAVVLVHSRAVFRDCFARCLEISYEDHVVYPFASTVDWLSATEPLASTPTVVIIVIEPGDASSMVDLGRLEDISEKTPVIVVSDIDDVDHIVRTLKRGARGYIPSSLPFNIAVEAVRLVEAGGVFLPASSFVDRQQPGSPAKAGVALTDRQTAVLEEIRQGKANKQIAYKLNMSEHTVKVHLRHIMKKLKARNRTEVAIFSESLLANSKA